MATVETTNALSLETIQDLLSESRTRGGYLSDVKDFFASGALAFDFTEKYPKKQASSLRNSVKQNVDKVEGHPACQIVLAGEENAKHVILINMDTYKLQAATTNEA